MKLLFSLAVVVLGVCGQQERGSGAEIEDSYHPALNASVPFNETDKTQFSRRQWMEIAINQFFDDFEAGITQNAPYLFARGAPYVSNGIVYAGLDMSNAATWQVIPPKKRVEREFSVMNRTETWVRCMSMYPDGHVSIEFTAFTFDRRGMITTFSKIESKECPPAPSDATTSESNAPTSTRADLSASTTATNANTAATTGVSAPAKPALPTASPTNKGKAKGKGKV